MIPMNKANLKNILTAVRDMINRSRIAYKDYLGEETVTETKVLVEGTLLETYGPLILKDPSFTRFVAGEEYEVTIDGTTQTLTAISNNGVGMITNVTDFDNPGENYFAVVVDPESGQPICIAIGTYIGKTISISQTKTTTTKKYDIKKVPQELIPDTTMRSIAAANAKAKKADSTAVRALNNALLAENNADNARITANNAQTAASDAQNIANAAFSTAKTAKTTAETAKTTAETAQDAAGNAYNKAKAAQSAANNAQAVADSIKPDWNEADITSPKYIANKPCYYTKTETQKRYSFLSANVLWNDETQIYWYGRFASTREASPIDAGKKYRIDGDTKIYTCKAYRNNSTGSFYYRYIIGNAALASKCINIECDAWGNPIPDTGEDWAYVTNKDSLDSSMFTKTKNYKEGHHFYEVTETLKTLDPLFLPPTIQQVGDDVIINSSTLGSTKKFKITVDDSGALSAIEVS